MPIAYSLSGSNLVAFNTASPSSGTTIAITGIVAGETLVGIDFRPQNGMLYGLGVNAVADSATLYAISARTGVAAPVGTPGQVGFTTGGTPVDLPDSATAGYGLDFNPAADRVRVTTSTDLNFRINPNTGAPVDGDGTGLTSGALAGTNPDGAINPGPASAIGGTAYTNNQPNNGNVTTQYTLDPASGELKIQNPPNTGTQTVVGSLGLGPNLSAANGFDIPAGVNATGSNSGVTSGNGFALLTVAGVTGLYSIALPTGAATSVGRFLNGTTAASGLAVQSDLGGVPAIGLAADGASLLRFNTATPGTATTQAIMVAGLAAGEQLVGIDFRPQTGQLYGLAVNAAADTGSLYIVDPQTGVLTRVGAAGGIAFVDGAGLAIDLPTGGYGFDFNPTVDRIRVTTESGLNLRLNPDTGGAVDGNAGGAAIPGVNPDGAIGGGSTGVSAAAYTNSFGQTVGAGATTLYTLDAVSNSLFIQNPANGGTQTAPLAVTFGGAPIDFSAVNGFDIPAGVRVGASNAPAAGFGFAELTVGGTTSLYRIDLASGAATSLGSIGIGFTELAGLALADARIAALNAAPVATDDFAVAVQNTALTLRASALIANDSDADNDPLVVSAVGGATNGTVALDGATGAVTFTPAAGFVGAAGFTYTLSDTLGGTDTGAVTVNVASAERLAYALSGSNLVAFNTASPSSGTTIAITGIVAGETLVGIDFRPQNGMLYGLGVNAVADSATLYAISARTGVAAPVGPAGQVAFTTDGVAAVDLPDAATAGYGFDFNPAADRVRVTTSTDLNFRINPNTGTAVDGDGTGLTSGALAGTNPDGAINPAAASAIGGTAYTNNQPNNGNVTTQYTLDPASGELKIQNPPNAGTQTVVGSLGLGPNLSAPSGFDIPNGISAGTTNAGVTSGSGLALLSTGGVTRLYSVDLPTGAASALGTFLNGTTPVSGLAVQGDLGGLPAIGLTADGATLLRFNTAGPSTVATQAITVAGLAAGEQLVGIDFRPQTGQLYGLAVNAAADTGSLYIVDPQTGVLTRVGAAGGIAFVDRAGLAIDLPTGGYGFDFNPTVDRIRVTTESGLNLRLNPNNGAAVDGGAATAGVNPDGPISGLPASSTGISAAAYTNSFGQALNTGATTLYTLDAASDGLFIQNPANGGAQTARLAVTVGGAPLDFTAVNGFDISGGVAVATSNGPAQGSGFAGLTVAGSTALYRIDLASGAATSIGPIGGGATSLAGLALADAVLRNPTAPTITTAATQTVLENTTVVAALASTDPDLFGTNPAVFSIAGGPDAALFSVSGGNLVFQAPRDFERQATSYGVQVAASDGTNIATKLITVTLADVTGAPAFGTVVTDQNAPTAAVVRLYDTLLDRPGDLAGLAFFAEALEDGVPIGGIAAGFLSSSEFQGRFGTLSDRDFVDLLYAKAFSRDSDADPGSQFWRDALASGSSRADVALGISEGAEHRGVVQPAFAAGIYVPNDDASEVARLYYGLLDRAPDAGGFGFYVGAAEGGTPLSAIAESIIAGQEYQGRFAGLGNRAFVVALYDNALGRDSDIDPGSQFWVDALDSGTTRGNVAAGITDGLEATLRLAPVIEDGILI